MPRCHSCEQFWITGERAVDIQVAGCTGFSCAEHRGKPMFDIDGYWKELGRLYGVTLRSVRVEIHGEEHVRWEEAGYEGECPCAKCVARRVADAAPKPPPTPPRRTKHGHLHGEAFALMRYEGKGGLREWIWNSRDGVTPFIVTSIDEKTELHHGNWHLDRYEPFFVPPVGSRIFVDLTEEIARPRAVEYVDRYWDSAEMPMREHPFFMPLGKEGAIEHFVREWLAYGGGHAPHLTVVTPAMHAQFKARAAVKA